MKLLLSYVRCKRWGLLFLALCLGICALVFGLYHLPLASVGYAALLCAVLALIWLVVDLGAYRRRHQCLKALQTEITVTLEHLPPPQNALEADYQALLQALDTQRREQEGKLSRQYRDMMEYYTIWAHQIKTPIAAMRLLLQEEDSPQSRALGEELQRVEQYVQMVLGYLRLDSESTDFVLRRCDLDTVVRQAVRNYAGSFIRKKIALDYQGVNVQVLTDEKWLRFVIEQVLSNALKYTRSGKVTISLEGEATLVIADTGIGIAPEDLPRIFERGFTGCNGRVDQRSSGIGLYLCRRILKQLGHGIRITSAPGQGTRVCLDLEQHPLEVE